VSCNVQAEAEETAEGLKITMEHAGHLVASETSISIDCKSVTRTGKKRIVCVVLQREQMY
jgi:predicted small metal-binding protein